MSPSSRLAGANCADRARLDPAARRRPLEPRRPVRDGHADRSVRQVLHPLCVALGDLGRGLARVLEDGESHHDARRAARFPRRAGATIRATDKPGNGNQCETAKGERRQVSLRHDASSCSGRRPVSAWRAPPSSWQARSDGGRDPCWPQSRLRLPMTQSAGGQGAPVGSREDSHRPVRARRRHPLRRPCGREVAGARRSTRPTAAPRRRSRCSRWSSGSRCWPRRCCCWRSARRPCSARSPSRPRPHGSRPCGSAGKEALSSSGASASSWRRCCRRSCSRLRALLPPKTSGPGRAALLALVVIATSAAAGGLLGPGARARSHSRSLLLARLHRATRSSSTTTSCSPAASRGSCWASARRSEWRRRSSRSSVSRAPPA